MYAAAKPLLEDLEARTSTLTPRVETVLATAKQAQANISAAQATYKKIKKPIAQLTPQAKQAREDTSKALDQLVQAQADLNTAQSTYKATKGPIVKISKKAASAKAAATKARTNLDAAQATYQTIQEPLTKIAPLAAQARADANQALQDVTRATTNYNRALNNYNATSAKVGSLGTNTDKLSATIKALETSYNRLNQAYQRTLDLKKQTTGQFPGGLESHLKTLFTQLEQAKALQEQLTANQPKQYTLQDLETQVDEHIGGLDSSKFKQFKTKALYKLNPKGTLYAAKKQGQTYLIVRATSCEQATETLEPFLATITSEDVSKIVNDDCVNRYNGQTGKKTFNFF
jgi:chromosome segregation ATPase